MSFKEIPVLDLSLILNEDTRQIFLNDLRHALVEVGFMLLTNYEYLGVNIDDLAEIKQQSLEFFELPDRIKLDCEMIHSPHFLGYTKLANEITALHTDWREQIDLATELPAPESGSPVYKNIEGPNLWPDDKAIPNFRPVVTNYIEKMTNLSTVFRKLVSEAIGLNPEALDKYFKPNQQCKMKIISYPDSSQLINKKSVALDDTPSTKQGCGPHRDSDFLTYIYQATSHKESLQVQNFQGQWITVPTIENSLVVNVGQTLESITQGICKATIHRVLIPEPGLGARISIPFFQTIDIDSFKTTVDNLPEDVLMLRNKRDESINNWGVDVGFQFTPDISKFPVGYYVFRNRIKSHQDVSARWYPQILKEVLAEYN